MTHSNPNSEKTSFLSKLFKIILSPFNNLRTNSSKQKENTEFLETYEINSISDLSRILQKLGEPEKGHTRFFRGHGNAGWQMLPSIYRETYLIENEDKIIKDALTYCPDDFAPGDTLFEKLVKLQHYGYNTRLLDLTTNALVALYFTVRNKEHDSKYGELIILDIPNKEIKYWDSDTVSILSAISLQENDFTITIKETLTNIKKKIDNIIKENSVIPDVPRDKTDKDILEEINNATLRMAIFHPVNEIEIFLDIYNKNQNKEKGRLANEYHKIIDDFLLNFNRQLHIIKLLQDIRKDKPYFRPVINPTDFQRVICVRAKLNNVRISRQHGCFLLFGINGEKRIPASIPDDFNNTTSWKQRPFKDKKFIIPPVSKEKIRKELKIFGISERTLFPELDKQATEIMEQYNPDSKKP